MPRKPLSSFRKPLGSFRGATPQKKGLLGTLGAGAQRGAEAITGFLTPALKRTSQQLGAGLGMDEEFGRSTEQAQSMNTRLLERAKREKDPQKRALLLKTARESGKSIAETTADVTGELRGAGGLASGEDPESYKKQVAKGAAETATLFGPKVGKGLAGAVGTGAYRGGLAAGARAKEEEVSKGLIGGFLGMLLS